MCKTTRARLHPASVSQCASWYLGKLLARQVHCSELPLPTLILPPRFFVSPLRTITRTKADRSPTSQLHQSMSKPLTTTEEEEDSPEGTSRIP